MTSDSASRVTRSKRDLTLMVVLFVGALAVVTALSAQDAPKAPPAAEQATDQVASPAPPVEGKTAPPSSATDRKPGTSPGRFEPSEKVRADFDVSFPVDI
jgi:hypothetical protein